MRAHEKAGDLHKIRGLLHSRLRTAALRNDSEGQAVLINCLLRSYIDHALFDQGRRDLKQNMTNDVIFIQLKCITPLACFVTYQLII